VWAAVVHNHKILTRITGKKQITAACPIDLRCPRVRAPEAECFFDYWKPKVLAPQRRGNFTSERQSFSEKSFEDGDLQWAGGH